jgi:hypothetical protein
MNHHYLKKPITKYDINIKLQMIVIYQIDMLNHWLINHRKNYIKKKLFNKYGVKKKQPF